jgi:hypothetical protein
VNLEKSVHESSWCFLRSRKGSWVVDHGPRESEPDRLCTPPSMITLNQGFLFLTLRSRNLSKNYHLWSQQDGARPRRRRPKVGHVPLARDLTLRPVSSRILFGINGRHRLFLRPPYLWGQDNRSSEAIQQTATNDDETPPREPALGNIASKKSWERPWDFSNFSTQSLRKQTQFQRRRKSLHPESVFKKVWNSWNNEFNHGEWEMVSAK